MDLAQFIPTHGYWIAFVGALLEGETILALAGLAAHRGHLHLPLLIVVGAAGGFLGDQAYFTIGRLWGARVLARYPRLQPGADRAHVLIEAHPELSIIAVRFLYGLRIMGPAVIGMSRVGWWHFAVLNAIGAVIWGTCWVVAGYLVGDAVEAVLGNLKHVEHVLFVVALAVALVGTVALNLWRWARRRR